MRIVLTGGGTGGHVVPNVAVIEELKERGSHELLYIGSLAGPEKAMIEKIGVRFEGVPAGKLRRYFSTQNFLDILRVFYGSYKAKKILKEFKPDVIFSKGGYVSVPVVFAAARLKIPIILHESDVTPGLANVISMRFAKKILLSFKKTKELLSKSAKEKSIITGNPVRKDILGGDAKEALRFTKLNDYRPVILVIGGSQGAAQINELVRESLDYLLNRYQVVHLVGRGNIDIGLNRKGYVQYEFLNEQLKDVYALAELVITRGGANVLAELGLLKKKAIVIPLSTDGSRGDQIENARVFVKEFGWSMLSGKINKDEFMEAVDLAFRNRLNLRAEIENGTEKIVDEILKR